MELERKVYNQWAFKENEHEKAKMNYEIYQELMKKYRVSSSIKQYNCETKQMEDINFDNYDLVYERKAGYGHVEYYIKKNTTNLSQDELALIFDGGNLCFGYSNASATYYYVFED